MPNNGFYNILMTIKSVCVRLQHELPPLPSIFVFNDRSIYAFPFMSHALRCRCSGHKTLKYQFPPYLFHPLFRLNVLQLPLAVISCGKIPIPGPVVVLQALFGHQ